MPHEIVMPPRHMFWHETAYAIKASNPRKAWNIDDIVGEICRVPENSHHVPVPLPPVSVYGLEVDQLNDFVRELKASAELRTETYTVQRITRTRKQARTKPIMLVGVASYPEPDMRDTDERRGWIGLVVDSVKKRVEADSGWLLSAVLHLDESYPHLHLICTGSTPGSLVRSLHWGLVASDAEPVKSRKGKAYREIGGVKIQDWFFSTVGSKMNWSRHRPDGERMPRLTPSQNNRIRQKKLEDEAAKIEAENWKLRSRRHTLEDQELMVLEGKARLAHEAQVREAELTALESNVNERAQVQAANEEKLAKVVNGQAARKSGLDKEWEILTRKAEKIRLWEESIREREDCVKTLESLIQDQFSWEMHKRRGVVLKPSPGSSRHSWFQDDDLDDVPL